VSIVARRFAFTPARVRIERGTRVEIELSSGDVAHGFELEGVDGAVEIPPRGDGVVRVAFTADEAGRFRFRCVKPCGAGHAEMRGVIVVE